MLRFESVSKRFGTRNVLDTLDLELPGGVIYGLLGPNGAGKTTALRLLMGLLKPSAGRVRLFQDLPPGHRDARRRIGYMPQALALYPTLSARENVHFFGHLYAVQGATLGRRTEELLSLVELSDHADVPIAQLSGGMARRAMLASALVHEPDLLILDEPTAGVDPALRVRFWDWFESLRRGGTTILITTHHIAEAGRAGRVLFLREGRLLADGSPAELMERFDAPDLERAFVHATTDNPHEAA